MEKYILTENGSTQVNKKHKNASSSVYSYGVLGSATATITYKTSAGDHVPFTDGLLVIGDQIQIMHGVGVEIYVTVENASDTTAVEVMCAGID